jgi:D-sedoheptulose 7-phosphate isomerase
MSVALSTSRDVIARQMRERNRASASFFGREAGRLAALCRRMADRFERGGRLLAFGSGPSASDAQHIAVEFVHPVLVGKRALPALDLSPAYREWLPAILRPDDIVIALAPPGGDAALEMAVHHAMAKGALSIALPGAAGDYAVSEPSSDPFVHQELIETLYHTLWETVHVFFERRPLEDDGAAASFLYPFLGDKGQPSDEVLREVAASIRSKAAVVERLREQVAAEQSESMSAAVLAMLERVEAGATILCFGNGGSATDATDLAIDLTASPKGYTAVPAISLACDAAVLTALANDIGRDAMFVRQLIAHGRPGDVALAISTSGGSSNIIAALADARARGLLTVALVGYDGGEVLRRRLADHVIVVNSDQIPRIQEVQASIYHVMLDLLEAGRHARD